MRTVDYSDILRGSAALAGLAPGDLAAAEFSLFRTAHDRRLQIAWESHRWPEICRYEQRSFRAPWDDGHAYAAGDEVLDIPTLNYLQALQPSTGQPPTTANVVNQAYWAPCQAQYQAEDYVAGTNYTVGAQVRNPADNQFYQLFALPRPVIRVSGAGYAPVNGDYVYDGEVGGQPHYTYAAGGFEISGAGGTIWSLQPIGGNSIYETGIFSASPELVPWYSALMGINPAPAVSSVIPIPDISDRTCWGRLTPFNRFVAYEQAQADGTPLTPIGEFLFAWDRDPRVTTKLTAFPYVLSAEGAQFMTMRHTLAYVWLLYRLRRPLLTGDEWNDAPEAYTSGQQVYFVSAAGAGNFYDCLEDTAAGESPATTPAKWALVELPYTFRQYLIQGGYADWLMGDGQTDKAGAVEGTAGLLLEMEADKLQRQQGQVNRLNWRG